MASSTQGGRWGKAGIILAALLLVLLLANTLMMGTTYRLVSERYNEEEDQRDKEVAVAKDVLEQNRDFAAELGVEDNSAVREALAEFNYEIEMATPEDDLIGLIISEGRRLQETILREHEAAVEDQALEVINQDENVKETENNQRLTLEIDEGDNLRVEPEDFLREATLERLDEVFAAYNPGREQVIEVEVEEGEASLTVPYNPVEHIQSLNEEIDDLRLTNRDLRVEAGFEEMSGEGVLVTLSDKENGTTSEAIIHDTDVRDVVNELFSSGAEGVAVGGERLTATSSIRCAGTLIKVNDQLIPMPIEIKAVGDPELLESGLDIIKSSWEEQRDIGFEVEKTEDVELPGYQ